LPDADRARIAQRFAEFAGRSSPGVDYRLEFRALRSGPAINAFALPGGTIVVLDGLIEASGEDERVLAVLGHELGHVARRHPIRRVLATVGVGVLAGLLWGDISSVAANLGTVLGVLRYSREQEVEADDYAARMLDDAGLDARPLIEMFAILLSESRARGSVPSALATHPSMEERIQRLRTRPVRLERGGPPN
jgi:predicted Zn-dependent protease